jgi:hypothetical protein
MKRNVPLVLSVGFALILSLCAAGKVDALRKAVSRPIQVTIDGMTFHADKTDNGDTTLLRRELARLGVRPPDTLEIPEEIRTAHPVFSGNLGVSPGRRPVEAADLPRGLTSDHTVRMDEGGRTVELVFGKLGLPGASVRSLLAAKGWLIVSAEGDARLPRMLEKTQGKETAFVCLDEKEGTFLVVRKVDR